jgi:HAE1 family hydrophobic/amphiphilic exporter-1
VIRLAIRRPVATVAVYLALLLLGAYAFRLIPLELLPDVSYPRLLVRADWPGASPESLEALVTARIEGVARQVEGARSVVSVSRIDPNGTGSTAEVDVEFSRRTRMDFARLELGERLSALRDDLPERVSMAVEPYVPDEFAQEGRPFLAYRLVGPYDPGYLSRIADEEVRPTLLGLDGVAAVWVYGGTNREISIELDRERMDALGLTLGDVRDLIARSFQLRAPGSVEMDGMSISLAVRSRPRDVSQLRQLVVATRPEGAIRLSDLGLIRDAHADAYELSRIDGRPAIWLVLTRQAGSNAINVASVVKEEVERLAVALPPGTALELDADQSEDIREQLTDLRLRALAAALVIFLVLVLFLRSSRSVAIVFATIGFSILIAVNLLYAGGFSLNVLTLAGLAWGFGIVVDNGIVVLESVERHVDRGADRKAASRDGSRQVLLPVIAATGTTAIVLVPFLLLQGDLHLYYLPLGYAVGFSILASLFVAFTFVPAMMARGAARDARSLESAPATGSTSPVHAVDSRSVEPLYLRVYRTVLESALGRPLPVAAFCAACLAGSFWLFVQNVDRGVLWSSSFGRDTYIAINIRFPRGSELETTDQLARSFEARLAGMPEVERFETLVRPSYAQLRVTFPAELEDSPVPAAIKDQLVAYGYGYSGAEIQVLGFGPSFYGGGGSAPTYTLQVFGFNYLKVKEIAFDVAARLERFPRVRNADPNSSGGWFQRDRETEMYVEPDRAALASHDLTVDELLTYVAASTRGVLASERLRLDGEEVRYAVKLAGYRELDVKRLENLRVPTRGGSEVELLDVATVGSRDVLASIRREDQQYERSVSWEYRGPPKLGDLVRKAVIEGTETPPGYRLEVQDEFRWPEEQRRQVYLALGLAVLLIYMLTAALFESLTAPLVVLMTLPLALIGVFLIFFYTDATFTRTAYIGTIMMAGIVVNNAILIVYHIGELRKWMETRAAIIRGTLERVRPILMTTFTTVFGLTPLILFSGSQNENIWNALALATIGGLLSSTVFVLIAIPVAYRYLVAR